MTEIVQESCGFLAKELISEAMAEVIREAFADPETLRGKGRACRAWVEKTFSEEEMLGRFEEMYGRL